jgi:hypothetical protein
MNQQDSKYVGRVLEHAFSKRVVWHSAYITSLDSFFFSCIYKSNVVNLIKMHSRKLFSLY